MFSGEKKAAPNGTLFIYFLNFHCPFKTLLHNAGFMELCWITDLLSHIHHSLNLTLLIRYSYKNNFTETQNSICGGKLQLTRKVLSQEDEQRAVPSGDTLTLLTRFSWPNRMETRVPFNTSHTFMV